VNDELIETARTGDAQARELLICRWRPKVLGEVRRLKYRNGLEFSDLVQEGMIGLLYAVDRFDAAKGCRFAHWASLCIRSALRAALNKERSWFCGKEEEQETVGLDDNLIRAEDRQYWKEIMNGCLNARERRAVKLRLWEQMEFEDIGKEFNLSKSGAVYLYDTAISKLRAYCQENNIDGT
jgi:RNA polymerase sigma factor (sigma-70 family)